MYFILLFKVLLSFFFFQRCPLHQLILKVKLLDLGEPKYILGLALSPPNLDDIEKTIVLLLEVSLLLYALFNQPHLLFQVLVV